MAKTQTNNVKLGFFVILVFVIFTYGIYRIGDRKDFFGDTIELFADFQQVKGLQTGNNVRFAGINIGSVEAISILNDSTLRVRMVVESSAENYLHKNALAEIGSDGLVGNMVVNIMAAKGTAPLVQDGDFIAVKTAIEITAMLETLATTNETIVAITQQLLEITEKMNDGEGSIALLLNDKMMAQNLISTTHSLQTMTQSIDDAANEINQMIGQVSSGQGNLGYLLQDTTLKTQVNTLSSALDSLIAIRSIPIIENLNAASEAVANASQEIEKLVDPSKDGDGLVKALLSDTSATNDLRAILGNLNEGTKKLDENMEALQYSWPFRKFFRKKKRRNE
jgi:phospholipid/cholesterol/gamma-HCH transport system substrate-binding protein